MDGC